MAILGEVGYDALSMAAVAERARVGRPTIYRRFASKQELVVDALLHADGAPPDGVPPDSPAGDARAAVSALLEGAAAALARPGAMTVIGSLLAHTRQDALLTDVLRGTLLRPRSQVVQGVLTKAVASGEVSADADIEVVDAMLFGSLLARALMGHQLDTAWVGRVMSAIWRSLTAGNQPLGVAT